MARRCGAGSTLGAASGAAGDGERPSAEVPRPQLLEQLCDSYFMNLKDMIRSPIIDNGCILGMSPFVGVADPSSPRKECGVGFWCCY
jgi:hypothetical protein